MVPPDAMLKSAAATIAITLAVLILVVSPRDRSARWLSAFFGLIGANQAAEVVRSASGSLEAYRIATIAASLDPVALFFFAALVLEEEPRRGAAAAVVAMGSFLALLAGWSLPRPDDTMATHWIPLALSTFTTIVYGWVARRSMVRLRADHASLRWRALTAASILMLVPSIVTIFDAAVYAMPRAVQDSSRAKLALTWSLVALAFVWAWSTARGSSVRGVRAPLILGFGLVVLLVGTSRLFITIAAITGVSELDLPASWMVPGRATASARWLIVGGLVSAVVFSGAPVDASPATRRRVARVFVALAFLLAGVLALAMLASVTRETSIAMQGAVVLLSIALSQAFQSLVDRVATRVYGVPRTSDADSNVALRPGVRLHGRYRIEGYAGRGGGGRTFVARDELLGRTVAIKEVQGPIGPAGALREARAASRVHHRGVLSVYDVLPRPDGALIVTEYLDGGTLADLARARPLTGASARSSARELIEAVAAIHREGLVHGDLKPSNILLDARGSLRVADFGLARSADATTSLAPAPPVGGTEGFVPPEVVRGRIPDQRSDVYSLGLVLERCFELQAMERVIERALADEPASRWADAGEMLSAFDAPRAAPSTHAQ